MKEGIQAKRLITSDALLDSVFSYTIFSYPDACYPVEDPPISPGDIAILARQIPFVDIYDSFGKPLIYRRTVVS